MSTNNAMMVCDSDGNALTDGLESVYVSDQARQSAQRLADERGASVWLSWSRDDEETDEYSGGGVEIAPSVQ